MLVRIENLASTPHKLVSETYDCLWVELTDRQTPTPLSNSGLAELDWQLGGVLSRFIKSSLTTHTTTLFISTKQRLSSPLVAIEKAPNVDFALLARNCVGMGLKHIGYFPENAARVEALAREFGALVELFPQEVVILHE